MKFTAIAALLALSGCGSIASYDNPEKTGYVMVSKGEASLLYRAFVGGVDYCKATQHNLDGVEFTGEIVYEGDSCRVEIVASDK